jgi:hypothetical protein
MNTQDEDGKTALDCAVEYGHTEVALLLLNENAKVDVDVRGKDGRTALQRVRSWAREKEKLRTLLKARSSAAGKVEAMRS